MKRLDYVHITQGTASQGRFSNGNTLPLTQYPFGMAAFAPQTQRRGPWYFHPYDRSLEGVRLTHQPSPWIGDFGTFLLMPQAGAPIGNTGDQRWSGYRPEEAVLKPHYMKLGFLRSRSELELVPTERGAVLRLNYTEPSWQPVLSVLRLEQGIEIALDPASNRVYGAVNYVTDYIRKRDIKTDPFRLYFVLEFEHGINAAQSCAAEEEGWHIALNAHQETVRLATSYISREQAVKNLNSELAGRSFDALLTAAEERWEEMLGRIEIETADEQLMNTFYSCLYRALLFPNKMYEPGEQGEPIHYDVYSSTVKSGYLYTNNGFWDTYRTVYPLLSLVAPEMNKEILKGYLQFYLNVGWLPRWPALWENDCMPGTLIDAVMADGAVKGLLDPDDLQLALEGLLKHGEQNGEGIYGRRGMETYLQKGYVPRSVRESVNCNQDYAYGDYCIAQVARLAGKPEIAERYEKRSKNYKNLFDPETGFMRSRDEEGNMLPAETFDPLTWGGDYTEGSAWQNSFAVFHDIDGLAGLYGGREQLIAKLDELFATPPRYTIGTKGYGGEIHEMTEMAAADFGQCAISNQPSFHYPWLFAALGQREKTAYWVEKLVREAFTWKPDGFPGDEDNGTMSAWYVFGVMGFYPLCPGKPEYIRGKQLADRVRIRGKEVPNGSPAAVFAYKDLIG